MPGDGTENQDGNSNAAAAAAAASDAAKADTATQKSGAADTGDKGSNPDAGKVNPLLELVGDDADTREWLGKQTERAKDVPSLAKLAREQDKMIGEQAKKLGDANVIRIPGKDATPEEIKAYKEKLDIPLTEDGYEFKAPKDLPAEIPYDGEKAKSFAKLASTIDLTKKQAQAVHDWAAENAVGDYTASKEQSDNAKVETARAETDKLKKLWGPLDGETFRANAAFADKALMEIGGQEAYDEFVRVGLIGNEAGQKIIQSAAIATMLAKAGQAIYKEDEILRGDPGKLDNPFADGPTFNLTRASVMIKKNRDQAMSFIAAAGKKPSDFGLTN